MSHRPLDPRRSNIAIDANALDRHDATAAALVDRLLKMSEAGEVRLILPKGVRVEIENSATPPHVKAAALPQLFTIGVGLNSEEQREKRAIARELQGNASPGKHAADADHLFEAAKYCGYFITHDQRILKKSGALATLLPPSLTVVTLIDFFEIFDAYEEGRII